jgi:hypothetical protein
MRMMACRALFEGSTNAITSFPQGTEGQDSLIMRQAAIDNITGKDEKDIDRALASLFVADASVVRCGLLAREGSSVFPIFDLVKT